MTPAGGTPRSLAYDASGNIVADTRVGALGMSFEYDGERRLSKAWETNSPANVATYGYDALNRLVSRTVNGVMTFYIHDLSNHIIAETDATGATLREYIWLGDLPVAVVAGANTATPVIHYVHTDHLGRPVRMTSPTGTLSWLAVYSPFGAVHATGGALQQDMRFPGQWFQLESGLAYNWNRHYDATLGRYVQPDPIGFEGGRNLYGYVGGNPLAYVDPRGLCFKNNCNTRTSGRDPNLLRDGLSSEFPPGFFGPLKIVVDNPWNAVPVPGGALLNGLIGVIINPSPAC